MINCKLIAVGTSVPDSSYSQAEILDAMSGEHEGQRYIENLKAVEGLHTRHLSVPLACLEPSNGEDLNTLVQRHRRDAISLGMKATTEVLDETRTSAQELGYLCCVTSTGYLMPTLSAHLARGLDIQGDIQRADLVGMGCSGAINGLSSIAYWCAGNPGRKGALICSEVYSAIYTQEATRIAIAANSLFGDGCATVIAVSDEHDEFSGFRVWGFKSFLATALLDYIGLDWDDPTQHWRVQLSRSLPRAVTESLAIPVNSLLGDFDLTQEDISSWLVHGGGPAIVEAIKKALNISDHDVRHTTSVLRDFGNVLSGSCLFSLQRLLEERSMKDGEFTLLAAMGPGMAIEVALLQWKDAKEA